MSDQGLTRNERVVSSVSVSNASGWNATGGRPPRSRLVLCLAAASLLAMAACTGDSDSDSTSQSSAGGVGTGTGETIVGGVGVTGVDGNATDPAALPGDPASGSVPPVPEGGETTTTVPAPTTTTIPPTTTTTIPLITEGAIVIIANAADVPGAAGQLTARLQQLGYTMKEATDAAGYEEFLDSSKIYFRPEGEAAAMSLAQVMAINSVTRMPTPAPINGAMVGLADATVLIMLGRDLAGKEIPGLANR